MRKRWLLGLLVAALALAVTGCSAVEDKIGEEIGEETVGGVIGSDVEVDGDSVTITGEDGDVTIAGGEEIPAPFPDDFPLYDDADLDSASSIESAGDTSYYLSMVSGDSSDDVYEWYKTEFEGEGWEIVSDMNTSGDEGMTAIVSVKKGDVDGSITVASTESGCDIGVIVTTK